MICCRSTAVVVEACHSAGKSEARGADLRHLVLAEFGRLLLAESAVVFFQIPQFLKGRLPALLQCPRHQPFFRLDCLVLTLSSLRLVAGTL